MLPRFLIIGAMKCGTTSLYRDLLANPRVFMPEDKEPNALCDDRILSAPALAEYERLFHGARPDQVSGEASTRYAKAPDDPGVPQRAARVLGLDLRLIYVIREPAARVASHHHHSFFSADIDSRDVNEAIDRHPQLIDWTRYAMQAQRWIDVFGREALRIVRFEDYVADRRSVVGSISEFIGVPPRTDLIELDQVHNKSAGKPVETARWKRVIYSPVYRKAIRPLLSTGARERLRGALLPKAREELPPLSARSVDAIYDRLGDDLKRLQDLLDRQEPLWDRTAVRAAFAARETPA